MPATRPVFTPVAVIEHPAALEDLREGAMVGCLRDDRYRVFRLTDGKWLPVSGSGTLRLDELPVDLICVGTQAKGDGSTPLPDTYVT